MRITVQIECENETELALVGICLDSARQSAEEILSGLNEEELAPEAFVPPVVMEDTETALPVDNGGPGAAPPEKKRGRPRKPKAETVSAGPVVLDQLKASIASSEAADNVVPMKKADPVEEAVFGVPEPAAVTFSPEITTGQQLQEYILSLVHQKRLNPVAVKAKVYPKYNVVRSLDLAPEQVAAAKADIDAMLTDDKPKAANDLDL